jgi:hypothetical protein
MTASRGQGSEGSCVGKAESKARIVGITYNFHKSVPTELVSSGKLPESFEH